MYYKLLNKTILTSAIISLICASAPQLSAQELVLDDAVDISLPSVQEEKSNATQTAEQMADELIPLDNAGTIVPEDKAKAPAEQELKAETVEPLQPVAPVADSPSEQPPLADDFVLDIDTISAPSQEHSPDMGTIDEDVDVLINAQEDEKVIKNSQTAQEKAEPKVVAEPVALTAPEQKAVSNPNTNPNPFPKVELNPDLKLGDAVLVESNNDLFNQMSDIEKQTTLLTLELKREKIRNEVEAAKAVREKAYFEKLAAEEEKARQQAEWEKEQEAKIIREQVALKQKEIELEKLRQQKALNAYMNSMLIQKQAWIDENSKLYEEINRLKKANEVIRTSYKNDLEALSNETTKLLQNAETAKSNYERTVASLTAQNAQLKKRIEADAAAARNGQQNPFATLPVNPSDQISSSADALIKPINISKEYAIMEIIGKGDDLSVKLINKQGDSFIAKKGTVLQTGHMVEDISQNYIQFDRNGLKDFLYTSTSALSAEPEKISLNETEEVTPAQEQKSKPVQPRANLIGEKEIPSLKNSMFVK